MHSRPRVLSLFPHRSNTSVFRADWGCTLLELKLSRFRHIIASFDTGLHARYGNSSVKLEAQIACRVQSAMKIRGVRNHKLSRWSMSSVLTRTAPTRIHCFPLENIKEGNTVGEIKFYNYHHAYGLHLTSRWYLIYIYILSHSIISILHIITTKLQTPTPQYACNLFKGI